ncbi:hypothetical protein [Protaetiibacter larvae]|uniref:Uncharacterized protein n=1 Tax=Protaetiibacter larvae TaxID=2592654 RepID=A0A5C1Y7F1_9MICO|nr:hypothetical protein [Protaetiibacter larvae]QEO10013.1 hypothetical protein FLP23_08350 [Protaetiibacter larvae]
MNETTIYTSIHAHGAPKFERVDVATPYYRVHIGNATIFIGAADLGEWNAALTRAEREAAR